MLIGADARALERCVAGGGVAIFPADTVYGLACDPEQPAAVARLYELKGRPAQRPAAVMLFSLSAALETLAADLTDAERVACGALLPGPVTLLLPNRGRRFLAACAQDPDTLGVRVPALAGALQALAGVQCAVMQSSANISGRPDARRLEDVDERVRAGADLELDGGELPGVASTVIDMREWASAGAFHVVREGALAAAAVVRALSVHG